jgi:5-methylthioadenosine/S-adenosylhomocysteine deaminase
MTSGQLSARWVVHAPGQQPSIGPACLRWEAGRVVALDTLISGNAGSEGFAHPGEPLPEMQSVAFDLPTRRRLIVPALVNAHDHARTYRSSTLGGWGRPLESWLPLLSLLPGVDPYLVAASSFSRSVRRGATAVMVHYTRVQGTLSPVDEALAVARAARDVGLRIGFAVALRDARPLGYCDDERVLAALRPEIRAPIARRLAAPMPPFEVQLERFAAIAAAIDSEPELAGHVTVQLGPTAVQWCTEPLLKAVARISAQEGRPVHMHLLETRYQREWADRHYPDGIVRFLDAIGLLSARLTLAHCTWARPDELELLAERGVTIAVNTSSNLHLRSGIAPLAAMREAGCRIAMGLDGLAFDEDDDGLREMRLAGALHRGWGFESRWSDADLWRFASATGRRSVMGAARDEALPGGRLLPGHAADFLLLDLDRVDDDRDLIPGVDPAAPLMARGRADAICGVVARGRPVVVDGRVTGVNEPAIREALASQTREAIAADPTWASWRDALVAFDQDLRPFYRSGQFLGCC